MLLIDGDILVYRVGFATQNEKDPVYSGQYNLDRMIMQMLGDLQISKYRVFLTGSGNFRKERATLLPYKGNRKISHRPVHYDELREYLTSYWKALVVEGMEADDAMGIAQMQAPEGTTIICSIDKDLDMIPGWHYNFVKKSKYFVDEFAAYKNFYIQVLMGDDTDNIPGLKGVGRKTAEKLLSKAETVEQLKTTVNEAYKNAVKDHKLKLKGTTIKIDPDLKIESVCSVILDEIKHLLWIRRGNGADAEFDQLKWELVRDNINENKNNDSNKESNTK